jgi:hypothetical protein
MLRGSRGLLKTFITAGRSGIDYGPDFDALQGFDFDIGVRACWNSGETSGTGRTGGISPRQGRLLVILGTGEIFPASKTFPG